MVWRALDLPKTQDPAHHAELMAPLLTARAVAELVGVTDPSIIYRWEKGRLPAGRPPFPASIDLSKRRKSAHAKRWRRDEVLARDSDKPLPEYEKAAPIFGSLSPVP